MVTLTIETLALMMFYTEEQHHHFWYQANISIDGKPRGNVQAQWVICYSPFFFNCLCCFLEKITLTGLILKASWLIWTMFISLKYQLEFADEILFLLPQKPIKLEPFSLLSRPLSLLQDWKLSLDLFCNFCLTSLLANCKVST